MDNSRSMVEMHSSICEDIAGNSTNISPKRQATGSNPAGGAKMNDPTQFEQVDETCGSGRVVLHLKSLGMTVFFEDIIPKRI